MAGGKFSILRSKVELRLPLSQLYYNAYGLRFRWNEVWLAILYEQQPLKFAAAHLLEEFKDNLKGEITIRLRCHRIYHKIEEIELITDEGVFKEVADITSRIEQVTSEIQSLAAAGTLTLDEAQVALAESGLKYKNIHRILSEIINNMPLQQIQEEVEVPLSSLQYDADGVGFSWGDYWFQVQKDGLPFETSPILEEIKSRLEGAITFCIERRCFVRWDSDTSKLWVGQVSMGVKPAEIAPETLEKFKELRGNIICDKIRTLDRATLSLDDVEVILKGWGLDLDNQEIGERIAASIPNWIIKWSFQVPAKDVQYSRYGIKFSSKYGTESIPSEELPFETSDVLDKIKDILEGDIKVTKSQRVGFIWSKTRQQLAIGQGDASYDVEVEDKLLKRVKYVHVAYNALKIKYPSWPDEKIIDIIRHSPGEIDKVPSGLITRGYDPECIKFLEERAEFIYATAIDLWFKIGDVLIWERPEYGAATYLFKWPEPEESLENFIARIWSYRLLRHIINDSARSNFIASVDHDYEYNFYNWKRKFE